MTQDAFAALVNRQMAECGELLNGKGQEYVPDPNKDALSNFKESGKDLDIDPAKVAMIFLNKHIRSIKTYIRTRKEGAEPITGRISDAINYLILLRALFEDKE